MKRGREHEKRWEGNLRRDIDEERREDGKARLRRTKPRAGEKAYKLYPYCFSTPIVASGAYRGMTLAS